MTAKELYEVKNLRSRVQKQREEIKHLKMFIDELKAEIERLRERRFEEDLSDGAEVEL